MAGNTNTDDRQTRVYMQNVYKLCNHTAYTNMAPLSPTSPCLIILILPGRNTFSNHPVRLHILLAKIVSGTKRMLNLNNQ